MPATDILSQEEIDALLHGVDRGEIETETDEPLDDDEVRPFDFTSQDRIVRGRLPTLEMVNERFARALRDSLFGLLRRPTEVTAGSVQMLKFSEYIHSLFMPASMNLVKVKPLRGTALFVLDPRLVFILVENFFGGAGRLPSKLEGREFTPTEVRVVHMVLDRAFADLKEAWGPVLEVSFSHQRMEVNPHFATIVSPSEVVVATVFHVELEGGGGDLHVTLPYSMLEPVKERLDAGLQNDLGERDVHWFNALRRELAAVPVSMQARLTETQISLRELMSLAPGDVIPVDLPELVEARVEGVSVLRGRFGVWQGSLALKVMEPPSEALRAETLSQQELDHE